LKSNLRPSFRSIDHMRAHQAPKQREKELLHRLDQLQLSVLEVNVMEFLHCVLPKNAMASSSSEKITLNYNFLRKEVKPSHQTRNLLMRFLKDRLVFGAKQDLNRGAPIKVREWLMKTRPKLEAAKKEVKLQVQIYVLSKPRRKKLKN
jgi:hypothetical protein